MEKHEFPICNQDENSEWSMMRYKSKDQVQTRTETQEREPVMVPHDNHDTRGRQEKSRLTTAAKYRNIL